MGIALTDLVNMTRRAVPERVRPPFFRTKKLAIIGCTASHTYAPWFDRTWTIASHASAKNFCQREPDWWFDMHRPECFKSPKGFYRQYYDWLKHQKTPIFMQENYAEIPGSVRYPKERILSEFRPYFTNHVAWMIALAMTEGVTHIGLYGCQYKHETEHGVQRESCVYWMGRFEGAGGTLILPPVYNNLLTTPKELYGYESHDAEGKLVPAYYRIPAGATVLGGSVITPLQEGAVPCHRDLGMPIAWERSGFQKPEVRA